MNLLLMIVPVLLSVVAICLATASLMLIRAARKLGELRWSDTFKRPQEVDGDFWTVRR